MKTNASLPADDLISCFGESSDCVKVIDPLGMLLSFNKNGYGIMEIDDPKDVIGKNWLEFWSGDMSEKAHAAFDAALAGTMGYFEGYCPTFKGTPRWWQVSVVPLKDSHGEVNWILAISRDITELQELREEVAQLRAVASV